MWRRHKPQPLEPGHVLPAAPVHATAGTGTWGTFDATLPFSASTTTMSTIRVYDISPSDGSPIDEVDCTYSRALDATPCPPMWRYRRLPSSCRASSRVRCRQPAWSRNDVFSDALVGAQADGPQS